MALFGQSLTNATGTGPGTAITVDSNSMVGMIIGWSGNGTAQLQVSLEGSIDGNLWAPLQLAGNPTPSGSMAVGYSGKVNPVTGSDLGVAPVTHLRANITQNPNNATVNAWVSAH